MKYCTAVCIKEKGKQNNADNTQSQIYCLLCILNKSNILLEQKLSITASWCGNWYLVATDVFLLPLNLVAFYSEQKHSLSSFL